MKKLFSILSLIAIVTAVIVACKDNFNESDFITLQAKLKRKNDSLTRASTVASQVAAMNTAGKLLAFTVQIVEDGKPLSGVAVLVTNDAGQSSVSNTATTDANGNAIFKGIPIGGNTVTISKAGYMTAAMVVDFGTPRNGTDYILDPSTQAIIPTGRTEAITAEMFPNAANGSTAVIKGTVRIDNDLTNAVNVADALPSGLQVVANFNDFVWVLGNSNRVSVNSYTFASGNVGVGTITNGAYSMTVPASASGRNINLIIPNITGTQHIALNGMNNVAFAGGPAYQDVPTVWGPSFAYDNSIPAVVGAKAVFPAPPAVGTGLANAFTFPTAVARSLNFASQPIPNQTAQWTTSNITYQFDRGTGPFGSSPTVSLSSGGASTQAALLTTLKGSFTGFTGISSGVGYTGNITVTFQYKDRNNLTFKLADFIVPSVGGGLPTTIDLSTFSIAGGNLVVYGGNGASGTTGTTIGFDSFNAFGIGAPTDVSAFSVAISGTGTNAAASPTFTSQVSGVFATNSGTGYTSAPTISTFAGGTGNGYTPAAQPILKILDFGLQWNIAFDNTKITSPYAVIPSSVMLNTANSNAYPIANTLGTSVTDQNGAVSPVLANILTINGTTISFVNEPAGGVLALHTSLFSAVPPTVVVRDITPVQAKATIAATDISTSTGGVTTMTVADAGTGYNSLFGVTIQPTITGAPGSGATMVLSSFTHSATGEQKWAGSTNFTITNQGSGYLPNLNQTGALRTFAPSVTSINVQTGQTYTVNIDYGTGFRQAPVQ